MMFKKIATALFSLFIFTNLSAQMPNPIHWSFCVNKLQGEEVELVMKATIDKEYHVWSQKPGGDGSLIPTTFTFAKNPNLELIGKPKEVGTLMEEDLTKLDLGIVKYYEKEVQFIQKAKLKADGIIALTIEFQACNHEGCLPPKTEDLSFNSTLVCGAGNTVPEDSKSKKDSKKKKIARN